MIASGKMADNTLQPVEHTQGQGLPSLKHALLDCLRRGIEHPEIKGPTYPSVILKVRVFNGDEVHVAETQNLTTFIRTKEIHHRLVAFHTERQSEYPKLEDLANSCIIKLDKYTFNLRVPESGPVEVDLQWQHIEFDIKPEQKLEWQSTATNLLLDPEVEGLSLQYRQRIDMSMGRPRAMGHDPFRPQPPRMGMPIDPRNGRPGPPLDMRGFPPNMWNDRPPPGYNDMYRMGQLPMTPIRSAGTSLPLHVRPGFYPPGPMGPMHPGGMMSAPTNFNQLPLTRPTPNQAPAIVRLERSSDKDIAGSLRDLLAKGKESDNPQASSQGTQPVNPDQMMGPRPPFHPPPQPTRSIPMPFPSMSNPHYRRPGVANTANSSPARNMAMPPVYSPYMGPNFGGMNRGPGFPMNNVMMRPMPPSLRQSRKNSPSRASMQVQRPPRNTFIPQAHAGGMGMPPMMPPHLNLMKPMDPMRHPVLPLGALELNKSERQISMGTTGNITTGITKPRPQVILEMDPVSNLVRRPDDMYSHQPGDGLEFPNPESPMGRDKKSKPRRKREERFPGPKSGSKTDSEEKIYFEPLPPEVTPTPEKEKPSKKRERKPKADSKVKSIEDELNEPYVEPSGPPEDEPPIGQVFLQSKLGLPIESEDVTNTHSSTIVKVEPEPRPEIKPQVKSEVRTPATPEVKPEVESDLKPEFPPKKEPLIERPEIPAIEKPRGTFGATTSELYGSLGSGLDHGIKLSALAESEPINVSEVEKELKQLLQAAPTLSMKLEPSTPKPSKQVTNKVESISPEVPVSKRDPKLPIAETLASRRSEQQGSRVELPKSQDQTLRNLVRSSDKPQKSPISRIVSELKDTNNVVRPSVDKKPVDRSEAANQVISLSKELQASQKILKAMKESTASKERASEKRISFTEEETGKIHLKKPAPFSELISNNKSELPRLGVPVAVKEDSPTHKPEPQILKSESTSYRSVVSKQVPKTLYENTGELTTLIKQQLELTSENLELKQIRDRLKSEVEELTLDRDREKSARQEMEKKLERYTRRANRFKKNYGITEKTWKAFSKRNGKINKQAQSAATQSADGEDNQSGRNRGGSESDRSNSPRERSSNRSRSRHEMKLNERIMVAAQRIEKISHPLITSINKSAPKAKPGSVIKEIQKPVLTQARRSTSSEEYRKSVDRDQAAHPDTLQPDELRTDKKKSKKAKKKKLLDSSDEEQPFISNNVQNAKLSNIQPEGESVMTRSKKQIQGDMLGKRRPSSGSGSQEHTPQVLRKLSPVATNGVGLSKNAPKQEGNFGSKDDVPKKPERKPVIQTPLRRIEPRPTEGQIRVSKTPDRNVSSSMENSARISTRPKGDIEQNRTAPEGARIMPAAKIQNGSMKTISLAQSSQKHLQDTAASKFAPNQRQSTQDHRISRPSGQGVSSYSNMRLSDQILGTVESIGPKLIRNNLPLGPAYSHQPPQRDLQARSNMKKAMDSSDITIITEKDSSADKSRKQPGAPKDASMISNLATGPKSSLDINYLNKKLEESNVGNDSTKKIVPSENQRSPVPAHRRSDASAVGDNERSAAIKRMGFPRKSKSRSPPNRFSTQPAGLTDQKMKQLSKRLENVPGIAPSSTSHIRSPNMKVSGSSGTKPNTSQILLGGSSNPAHNTSSSKLRYNRINREDSGSMKIDSSESFDRRGYQASTTSFQPMSRPATRR